MKSFIRSLLPIKLIKYFYLSKILLIQQKNRRKNVEDVFTEIYQMNKWGSQNKEFSSGSGSYNEEIVSPYIEMISQKAVSENYLGKVFVDLGCGDFNVGKKLIPFCSEYIGVDIVKPIILRNQEKYGNDSIKFIHLDIVKDELPDGDVCFVRQVLQHLSNRENLEIIRKIKKYRWVFITEHYPTNNENIIPNIDMIHGSKIRVYDNSAVYLSEPPYKLPEEELEEVLAVDGNELMAIKGFDPGIIRTFLYKPKKNKITK
jgi:SAM-dependent methyltransferase